MIIKLYNTDSEINRIGKLLKDELEFNIKLKDTTNISRPTIILRSRENLLFNYAYIPEFNRYYFIENIEVFPNNIYNLSLRCDVLESYKDDILLSNAYISQQTEFNKYYNSDYQSEIKKEIDIYKSDVVLEEEKTNILVTIGG